MTPLSTQSVPGDADHEVSGRYSQIDELAPVPTKRNTHGTYTRSGLPTFNRSLSHGTYIAFVLYNHLAVDCLFVSYPRKAITFS